MLQSKHSPKYLITLAMARSISLLAFVIIYSLVRSSSAVETLDVVQRGKALGRLDSDDPDSHWAGGRSKDFMFGFGHPFMGEHDQFSGKEAQPHSKSQSFTSRVDPGGEEEKFPSRTLLMQLAPEPMIEPAPEPMIESGEEGRVYKRGGEKKEKEEHSHESHDAVHTQEYDDEDDNEDVGDED